MRVCRVGVVAWVIAGCSHPPAPRPLPAGVAVDCFLEPCRATADLDGDGRPDTVEWVARAGKRGLAIRWGAARDPLVLGAGTRTPVLELADEEEAAAALAGARPSAMDDDLSYVLSWRLRATLPAFLPPGRGPAIELSGGDAAWVVYLSRDDELYLAPLGF